VTDHLLVNNLVSQEVQLDLPKNFDLQDWIWTVQGFSRTLRLIAIIKELIAVDRDGTSGF
jgi:hypothetical protein